MNKTIEFGQILRICDDINFMRESFPEIARELDDLMFTVMNNHTAKCGHGTCSCQTMTFEQFHYERNLKFGTLSEARSYEFN